MIKDNKEYQIRTIDEYGDAIEVYSYDTKQEAFADMAKVFDFDAERLGAKAVVLEEYSFEHLVNPYKLIMEFGDSTALARWNGGDV